MKTFIFGSNKGGVSKSTSATCFGAGLAESGKSVIVIDADKQGSATVWGKAREMRDDVVPLSVVYRDGNLAPFIRTLEGKFDYCVIDVAGAISTELSSAMAVADVLVAPYKCSMYDLSTISELSIQVRKSNETRELIGTGELTVLIFQTMATTNHVIKQKERANFVTYAEGFPDLKLLKAYSSHRQAYIDTAFNGMGVTEMANRSAKKEMKALIKEVLEYV